MTFAPTQAFAQQLDREDPLTNFRSQFLVPTHGAKKAIYFLGNSLGLQPKTTATAIQQVLEQWSTWGVEAFFKGESPWLELHGKLTPVVADIVGANPSEVVIMNSLTVNLHLMLVSFYRPAGKRTKILCEAKAFPSDQYMLYTHVKQRGYQPEETIIEVAPREGEVLIREEDILAAIEQHRDELALVFWGGVNYYTGQVFNMKAITAAAHRAGATAGFDLAHAAGNIALDLHHWNVDFACWCSYKYLNAGPGAVGGVFIHERHHHNDSLDRFAGWWGQKKKTQFLMEKTFDPEGTAEGWQLSTPSPLLYASQLASLQLFESAGWGNIQAKNKRLTEYLWAMLAEVKRHFPAGALQILTPADEAGRGCQVSLAVTNGRQVFDFLTTEGVFADWREPDVIRVAPVGLYNTFEEVWQFAGHLQAALHKFAL